MAATPLSEFQTYLESIINDQKYQRWSQLYTSTDSLGKQPDFDMGLMVELQQPQQQEKEGFSSEKQEKIERLQVLEGIRKYARDHVLLIGRPGAGKTTVLKRLLWEEARKKAAGEIGQIPVLVRSRTYKTSVLDIINDFFAEHGFYKEKTEIESLLSNGQLLLLIDGLNELPDDNARQEVRKFRQRYRSTAMIFTSRDVSLGGDFGIDKKLEMQPLTETQMHEFVRAYLGQDAEQMLRQLNNRLQKFAETPLLLWMLCRAYSQNTGKLPTNLGEAFQKFTEIYDNSLKGDVLGYENYRSWCRDLLQVLAFDMMQGTATELRLNINKQNAETILFQFLDSRKKPDPNEYAKRWLEDLLKYHLLQKVSHHQIEFSHQLFQEYYAAESLLLKLPQLSDTQLKRDYLNYLKWTESIALMLALSDEAQAVRVVQLALEVDLMLGARLAGEVKQDFQKKTVGLVKKLEVPKRFKIDLLGMTRSQDAVEFLNNCLKDQEGVRSSAASALGEIGNERAVDALIQSLKDEDLLVRWNAVEALGRIGNERAVDALIQSLKHEYSSVSWRAAEALGRIGNERAVDALLQSLKHKYLNVDKSAVDALREIGNERAVDALIQSLKHEHSSVRWRAAEALGRIGNERAVDALIQSLKDEYSDVRKSAAYALGRIGNERGVDALLQFLKDEDSFVFGRDVYILYALEKIRNKGPVDALIQFLKDEDSFVLSSAADALREIGNERGVDALIQSLKDEDSLVRWNAVEALGRIGNERGVDALIQSLKDEDLSIRRSAADVLKNIAVSKNISQMWELLLTEIYDTKDIILKIQERCQFYNYEITRSPLENKPESQINEGEKTIINFHHSVGNVNTGNVNIPLGNQIGFQENQPTQ